MRIVAIDPGTGGGVAIYDGTGAVAAPLQGVRKLFELLHEFKADETLVLIERVGLHLDEMQREGSEKNNMAIVYRLQKMIQSSIQAHTVALICGLPVCWLQPRSWQAYLGLGKLTGETQTERKARYREYARRLYPDLKVTLKTQDAICMMEFGRRRWKLEPSWFNGKVEKQEMEATLW